MKLPNPDNVIIPRDKIEGYLLSSVRSVWRYEAVFFSSLGFTQAERQRLEHDIRNLLTADAQPSEETEENTKSGL